MYNGLGILKFDSSCHQCGKPYCLSTHRYATDVAIKKTISEEYKIPMQNMIIMLNNVPLDNFSSYADTGVTLNVLCTKQHGFNVKNCVSGRPPLPSINYMEYKGCGICVHHNLEQFCTAMMAIGTFRKQFGIYNDVECIIKQLFMIASLWYSYSAMEYAYNIVLDYTKPLKPNLKARGIKQRAIKMGLRKNASAFEINNEINRVKGIYDA